MQLTSSSPCPPPQTLTGLSSVRRPDPIQTLSVLRGRNSRPGRAGVFGDGALARHRGCRGGGLLRQRVHLAASYLWFS